jgi:osmotically-inducible protein OsmY
VKSEGSGGSSGRSGYISDEAIRRDVEAHIQHGSAVTSDIIVEVREGVVTLLGDVPHRLMKQQLEDAALSCPGVRSVHNKLNILLMAPWPDADAPRA